MQVIWRLISVTPPQVEVPVGMAAGSGVPGGGEVGRARFDVTTSAVLSLE
jgi:hypothetical protein